MNIPNTSRDASSPMRRSAATVQVARFDALRRARSLELGGGTVIAGSFAIRLPITRFSCSRAIGVRTSRVVTR